MIPNRIRYGNRGKHLEQAVIASQGSTVCLFQMQTASRQVGPEKVIRLKSPPDFYGSVCDTGILINFDAKEQSHRHRFDFYTVGKKGKREFVTEFQKQWLIRAGQRGKAIAGLLIEATHEALGIYFWFSWRDLFTNEASIEWSDKRMLYLGSSRNNIDFKRIIAAEWQQKGVA